MGSEKDVERFVRSALHVLDASLDPVIKGEVISYYRFNTASILNPVLRDRLKNEGIEKTIRFGFSYPPEKNAAFIHRSDPLVSVLAEYLLETALESPPDLKQNQYAAARCGVYETSAVNIVTSILLVRLRHKIEMSQKGGISKTTLAEEALLLAFEGRKNPVRLQKEKLDTLLKEQPSGNLDKSVIERELKTSLNWWKENPSIFETIARERSNALHADHIRVREAARSRGKITVTPGLPVDLIGLYVLLPQEI